MCGKCLSVSDPAWSLSCLTHLPWTMWTAHRQTECVSESHLAPDCEFYFSSLKRSTLSVCVSVSLCMWITVWDVQKEIKEVHTHQSLLVLVQTHFLFSCCPPFFTQSSSMMAISFSCYYSQAVSWERDLSGFSTVFESRTSPHFQQIFTLVIAGLPVPLCPRSNTWSSSALRCYTFHLGVS